jgi:hypothetical protein
MWDSAKRFSPVKKLIIPLNAGKHLEPVHKRSFSPLHHAQKTMLGISGLPIFLLQSSESPDARLPDLERKFSFLDRHQVTLI